ncbi:hypothetical protein [Flavobacterium anhuiense]|uniref:hypothetical protein n=1 Tax=Flavobacterium anhuiense TaxID=459526 RepID=UPI003D9822CE
MEKESVDSIYYHYDNNTNYGLKILIQLQTTYLLFDSSTFKYIDEIELDNQINFEWIKINYERLNEETYIDFIKEDELVSYFIKFSNNDIFYIFQRVDNLEKWEQDFEIVCVDDQKYSETKAYMNESWIEEIIPQ